jgi:hypothetical protein
MVLCGVQDTKEKNIQNNNTSLILRRLGGISETPLLPFRESRRTAEVVCMYVDIAEVVCMYVKIDRILMEAVNFNSICRI